MNFKQFTKLYNLHVLPAAHVGILLGNLVWKPFWGAPKLSHPGMPNHISNALFDIELISRGQWHNLLKEMDADICQNANLAKLKINDASEIATTLLETMGFGFEKNHLIESEISEVCTKVMDNKMRVELDQYLEQLKTKKQLRTLFRNPRKVYVITELYYGALTLKIEKGYELAFKLKIKSTKWPIRTTVNSNLDYHYTFEHNEVPFAYKMERIHGFNG